MSNSTTSQKPSGAENQQAIRKLIEAWLAAVRSKDISKLVSMVTDDAVFLPPGLPAVRGKPAVEAMFGRFFPQFRNVEQTAVTEEIVVAGNWAFLWGTETFILVPQGGAAPIQMQGKGMSILRRQADGSWKFARGINNLMPESAPQAF